MVVKLTVNDHAYGTKVRVSQYFGKKLILKMYAIG